MDPLREIDVEQIVESLRETIRRKRAGEGGAPASGVPASPVDGWVAADIAALHSGHDPTNVHFVSHRKVLGPLVVFAKKILRKLLAPVLGRQVAYNASNARVVTYLKERLDALDRDLRREAEGARREAEGARILRENVDELAEKTRALGESLSAREERLAAQIHAFKAFPERVETLVRKQAELVETFGGRAASVLGAVPEDVERLKTRLGEQTGELGLMREQLSRAEAKLRRVTHALAGGGERSIREREGAAGQLDGAQPDFDTIGFAERFWGSESELAERRRIYVDCFRGCDGVLDLGCGRGEFLELLRDAGIAARGVDLDLDMVLLCREKGLDVVRENAFGYLESLPDEHLGGVFGAQVVEHLESREMVRLATLCQRKLRPGGVLILETPNPACLMVFAQAFYMDPTHIRPVHPAALKYLVEQAGFREVEIRFTSPVDRSLWLPMLKTSSLFDPVVEQINRSFTCLNELLFGDQDYAVLARKPRRTPDAGEPDPASAAISGPSDSGPGGGA